MSGPRLGRCAHVNPMQEIDLVGVREAVSWRRRPLRRALVTAQEAAERGALWWAMAALAAATGHARSRRWAVQAIAAMLTAQLLANGIAFTKPRVRELVEQYLGALACGGGDCGCGPVKLDGSPFNRPPSPLPSPVGRGDQSASLWFSSGPPAAGAPREGQTFAILDQQLPSGRDFFAKALAERLTTRDVFRVTITSFLDAYNFDLRRLVKCCVHHILPSGHVVPFCAYNVLYREGHVPLPTLEALAAV